MGFVTSGLQSMIGGVSKQHPTKRFSSQCEEMINWDATPHDGLKRRSPTEFVASLGSGDESPSDIRMHSISRDREERYLVTVSPQSVHAAVRVFDEDGTEYLVKDPDGSAPDYDYLDQRTAQLVTKPLMERFDHADWHEGIATSDEADPTSISGPFGYGEFYKLNVNPVTGTTGEGNYYTDEISALDTATKQSVSIYVMKEDSADGDTGIRLSLVEDPTGTPIAYSAVFAWSSTTGALEAGATHADVDSDVEDVGGGIYRARMIYTPDSPSLAATRLLIELPYSGVIDGPEYAIRVFGLQITMSGSLELTDEFFPAYMAGSAAQNIRLLTVADYTFVSNAAITVEKDAALSDTQNTRDRDGAIIFFRQFAYNTAYSGRILTGNGIAAPPVGGWATWTTTTSNGSVYEDSQIIAARFYSHVTSAPESTYTNAAMRGSSSVVWVYPVSASDTFEEIFFDDGQGGDHIVMIRDTVEDFTLLPTLAPVGYKVKIDGDPTIEEDDYWVESERIDDGTSTMVDVRWVETIAPEIQYKFDEDTMPHQLIRLQDDEAGTVTGTPGQIYFEFGPVAWTDRLVGDDTSNDWPSFVDSTINGLTFVQNRLGFLSGSSITLSESNEFFSLFRTTVRQVPDSDRILVEPASQQVAKFYAAETMDERLIVIGDQTQFVMRGAPAITARTISFSQSSRFDALPNTPAESSGETIFFASPDVGDTRIMEIYALPERTSFSVRDASEQVPRYIRGEATDIAASPTGKCLCVVADEDPSIIYVFRWAISGDEKIQASWFQWQLGGDVVSIEWIEQTLYALVRRVASTGVYTTTLESLRLGSLLEDGTLPFEVHLDRREDLAGSYDGATDLTTFTFSYEPSDPALVTQPSTGGVGVYWLQIAEQSGTAVTVRGDYSSETCWAGELFESRYTFSRPYLRERSVPAGVQSMLSLPSSLVAIVLELRDTYSLDIAVEGPYRTDSFKAIRGPEINEAVLGTFTPADGMHRCGVMCDPRSEEVVLTNESPWPARVVGAEWEMQAISRGSRAPV